MPKLEIFTEEIKSYGGELDWSKVRPGTEFYCIEDGSIVKDYIGYLGKDSFLITGWYDAIPMYGEWFYDEYGITWAFDFDTAREAALILLESDGRIPDGCVGMILVQRNAHLWEFKPIWPEDEGTTETDYGQYERDSLDK